MRDASPEIEIVGTVPTDDAAIDAVARLVLSIVRQELLLAAIEDELAQDTPAA